MQSNRKEKTPTATETSGYQRRCRRNQRRGIAQVRAVQGDVEAQCECGAPTAALGLCTTLRPHGEAFPNYVVLCRDCVALAAAEGLEIVWLEGRETERAVMRHRPSALVR